MQFVVHENVEPVEPPSQLENPAPPAKPDAEPQSQRLANIARQESEASKTISLVAQVIEARPPFLIIGVEDLSGLQSGMALKVYQSIFGKETGRGYGAGKLLDAICDY